MNATRSSHARHGRDRGVRIPVRDRAHSGGRSWSVTSTSPAGGLHLRALSRSPGVALVGDVDASAAGARDAEHLRGDRELRRAAIAADDLSVSAPTGCSRSCPRTRATGGTTSMPSTRGSPRSSTSASGTLVCARTSPSSPSAASRTSYPASVSARRSAARAASSSSITRCAGPFLARRLHAWPVLTPGLHLPRGFVRRVRDR